jgi:hypothetical protein
MELSLEQLLAGKATKIKSKAYYETKAYVEPFLDYMGKFTSDFRIQAKLPEQITRTTNNEINTDDITYNRVWIQAVMPEEYSWDNHNEVIGFLYGLDVRKPIVKIYRGALNMACTNLCVFNPDFINIQELEAEKAINYRPIKSLMEQTSDLKQWITSLKESEWDRTVPLIEANLGGWMRRTISQSCDLGFGKVKLAVQNVVDAYKHMFIDVDSEYYIPENENVNMFTVYNAFTDLITNDGGKDIINKAEKTLLLRNILDF